MKQLSKLAAALLIAHAAGVTSLFAHVAERAKASLAVSRSWQAGQPVEVVARIESGSRETRDVQFEILATSEWLIETGPLTWAGKLEPGQTITLRYRAVPVADSVSPLRGRLHENGFPATEYAMEIVTPEASTAKASGAGKSTSRQASQSFTATGNVRFSYTVGNLFRQFPLKNAAVRIMDADPLGDDECGTGLTDMNGAFSITGSCSDIGSNDYPDLYILVELQSAGLTVKRPLAVNPYSYRDPRTFLDQQSSSLAFGTIGIGLVTLEDRLAYLMYNGIMEARQFMAGQAGVTVPSVKLEWPQPTLTSSYYNPVTNTINIQSIDQYEEVTNDEGSLLAMFTAIHEYGHHVMSQFGDLPVGAWGTHGLFQVKNPELAWSEGFSDFFATLVMRNFGHPIPIAGFFTFERHFHTDDLGAPVTGPFDSIELFIATILTDLIDATNDDQHAGEAAFPDDQGSGRRDNATIPFSTIFDVIRFYDPSTGAVHDHPRTIYEFWDGMKARHDELINLVSEVYREHHLIKPQPDLVVTAVSIVGGTGAPGSILEVQRTVANQGNETAVSSARVRHRLVSAASTVELPGIFGLADTSGANLAVNSANTVTARVVIPPSTAPGIYAIEACADSNDIVPESIEVNNCRQNNRVLLTVR